MSEPDAWLVTGAGFQYVSLLRESADAAAVAEGGSVVPLYRCWGCWSGRSRTQDGKDQQPRTKEAATMSDENERSVASTGSVAWISVSERLPPENVDVFVAAFTPSGVPAFYSSARWRMTPRGSLAWEDEDCVINYPTHWMPIPPPPTKSDQP